MKFKFILFIASFIFVAASCNRNTASNQETNNPPPPPAASNSGQSDSGQSSDLLSGEVKILMTSTGLTPAVIKVKKGTKLTFINNDTKSHWPASNPHPTHTDLPGFDPQAAIAPGQSWSYTFTAVGVWKFHDHLEPTHGGTVTVIE
ncbi:MAG TPA: cupredoxin domain-containing protein [Patescibacteria group bacterium]|jgi:plastocyanin|nr:cupredoxin domain-containing protein [Patescibacteria group bacterium]